MGSRKKRTVHAVGTWRRRRLRREWADRKVWTATNNKSAQVKDRIIGLSQKPGGGEPHMIVPAEGRCIVMHVPKE